MCWRQSLTGPKEGVIVEDIYEYGVDPNRAGGEALEA